MESPPTSRSELLGGRYAVERELGRTAVAAVYLVRDVRRGRRLMLRILHPGLVAGPEADRSRRAIAVAARLDHPHLLRLQECGEIGGRPFCTAPYADGETLRRRLERERQLPLPEAVRITQAIAGALECAHRAGVVLGDVTPENILLPSDRSDSASHPVLMHLGFVAYPPQAGATDPVLGTSAYLSPEQVRGEGVSSRSDIYALGCVAYEMLAGAPPFTGRSAQAIAARHATDPPPPLKTVRATIPGFVADAVERALAKKPENRFRTAAAFSRALASGSSRRMPRGLRGVHHLRLGAAGAGVVIAVLGGSYLRGSPGHGVVPAAASLAVLPFVAEGGDSALARLGHDLSITIGASLDGVGGLKVAEGVGRSSEAVDPGHPSLEESAAVGRRLGARSIVRGTVQAAGPLVRLRFGLYEVAGLARVGDALTVAAPRDSIRVLTDSAVWALLRQVWRRGEPPSPSLAAVTTRSLPALRAFLDGERELEAMRLEEAALAFRSAMAADSTFWLAYYRYALARSWNHHAVEPEVFRALRLHGRMLPEDERMLLALLVDTMPLRETVRHAREITRRFPEHWTGWLAYADVLTHAGPFVGSDRSDALAALGRVLALNPRSLVAWEHVFKLSLGRGYPRTPGVSARLAEAGWFGNEGQMYRLWAGLDRTGGVITAELSPLVDSLAELFALTPNEYHRRHGLFGLPLLHFGFTSAQLELNRRALAFGTVSVHPRRRAYVRGTTAIAWAARGQWDSALVTMEKVVAEHPGVLGPREHCIVAALENYGLAVIAAWLGAVPPLRAESRRAQAAQAVESVTEEEGRSEWVARLAWFDGLLASTRGDRRALRAAQRDAQRSGYVHAARVGRSLAAFDRALAGDRRGAGEDLATLEDRCLDHNSCDTFLFTPHIGVHRLAAAQWLAEAGDPERARRLLRWQDLLVLGGWRWTLHDVLAAPTYLARGRLEEAGGDAERAREHYQQFLMRYQQPISSQAHLVEEARQALARLQEPAPQ